LFFSSFYILKPLHNNFIINLIEDIFLNVTKMSFIHLSLILFRNLLFTICIAEKTFFTLAVATGRSNDNLIRIYINENIKFLFVLTIFYSRLAILSILENSSLLHRSIIYVLSWSPSTIRSTIENSLG